MSAPDDPLHDHYAAAVCLVEDIVLTNLRANTRLGKWWPAPPGLTDDQVDRIAAALTAAARCAVDERLKEAA